MAKPKRMSTCEIMQVLEDRGVAQTLSYDYSTSRILRDGEEIEPKLEALRFIRTWNCHASIEDYQNAMYYWARENTPKPEVIENEHREIIAKYLEDKTQVSITSVLSNCLNLSLTDKYRRSWEIKASKIMRELGWTKYRTNQKRYWVKENTKLDDIL